MKYDITKHSAPKMPTLGKGTEYVKILPPGAQNTCKNPLFRCFSLFSEHIWVVRNLCTPTSFGRYFVAKWPTWWPKMGGQTHENWELRIGCRPIILSDHSSQITIHIFRASPRDASLTPLHTPHIGLASLMCGVKAPIGEDVPLGHVEPLYNKKYTANNIQKSAEGTIPPTSVGAITPHL